MFSLTLTTALSFLGNHYVQGVILLFSFELSCVFINFNYSFIFSWQPNREFDLMVCVITFFNIYIFLSLINWKVYSWL